ncbi:leiomodin-2a [Colossoma macropomum]|uniref:leiomodin-2a n=1 Tax=Colossoma macropomum TaxID=42526 RepID=UPI001864FBE1|nr:leiomodin-2a [Colossoma macropomum]
MSSFGYRKELHKYEDVDEDELLATLTNEELQELEREMADIDPDENTPIGLRQRDQTAKQPTGTFCREALLKHWQNDTHKLLETERSEYVHQQENMDESQTDKSEEECLSESDTEASPGTQSLLNNQEEEEPQNKRHGNLKKVKNCNQMFIKSSQPDCRNTGSNGNCRGKLGRTRRDIRQVDSNFNVIPEGASKNSTDTDGILEKILKNDESVSEVNLNNIDNISQQMLISFAEALTSNTHVRVFSLANTHADDQVAFALANTIKKNYYITSLNIESNFISGRGILALLRSLQQNTSLVELRFHNQRHICGGQVEMEMVNLLRENTTLLKLGYQFDLPGPRMSATSILTRNQDRQRQTRLQLRRQSEKTEETIDQTSHTIKNGTSNPQNTPDKRLVTSSQGQERNSLPKPKPQLAHVQKEKNVPSRKIAEIVKSQEEITADNQGQNKQNTKMWNQTKERESGDLYKDVKHALKPPSRKNQEDRNGQRSVHGDLMAAIRSSRMTTLTKVKVLHQCS